MEKCLAIDIGGSKVLVGVVDETGIVVEYDRKDIRRLIRLKRCMRT